ncbi:Aldehyde dehydrogenase [Mycena sanguinolenta]|uniref:aldehyde dehydrogenase (NAD(+)) n=1 Tax=Mycena sanguinolenta TaxID=230812 RepID=A0A8H6YTK2_9AGAR|nr:Aldehyde dehydrogenase [Mycena sanguinolenta]
MTHFNHEFNNASFTGKVSFPTGLFINGEFVDGVKGTTFEVFNPTTGKVLTNVTEATAGDVDLAVKAAQKAFETTWGLNAPGALRSELMHKLASLMEKHNDELCAIEALDNGELSFLILGAKSTGMLGDANGASETRNVDGGAVVVKTLTIFSLIADFQLLTNCTGKTFWWAKMVDVAFATATFKYYAGWADKIGGQTIETDEKKLAYTRHEPIGVVGQITPCAFFPSFSPCSQRALMDEQGTSPLLMFAWKVGPALATGNTIVIKPSEFTPLTAIRMCSLIKEAGFPPGVINVVTGYGNTAGQAIAEHMDIQKVAFTGSVIVGRKIMAAAAATNLKNVTLELGGKSPNIIFDDADLEQAVGWAAHGVFWNHGQSCCAGSRIYVQEGIYDKFLEKFTERTKNINVGDPFEPGVMQGPQVSQQQYDRIMAYIESGKKDGATVHVGGNRHGKEGYFIEPTIFTDTKEDMKIVKEEIFGPVGVVIKFKDEADVLRQANDSVYGLAAAVFTQDINRAIETAHKLQAGTAWINCVNQLHANVPFGGYKQSGIGRELGEYALHNYTNVKAVHVNLGHRM